MTGIFFGSTTGTTESVAARIAERLGVAQADVHNVAAASVEDVKKYDLLLLGSSTWGSGELQDDWPGFLDKLGKEDLSGRRVALFVHGCFWHQHPGCKAADRPKSRPDYWNRKLDGNVARDARHLVELAAAGWTALVIWECETRDPQRLAALAARIKDQTSHKRPHRAV